MTLIDYGDHYFRSHYAHLLDGGQYARLSRYVRAVWFESVEESGPVLEYGCGLGVNVAWAEDPHGYDISPEARAFCRSKGMTIYDTSEDIPSEHFPVVLSSHSLEHVDEPLSVLGEMWRVLTPGGTLVLALPKEEHGQSTFEPDNDCHLYSWTFRTANNLLMRAGFTVIDNRMVNGPTGLTRLAAFEGWLGESNYLRAARLLGRFRGVLPTLRVLARKPL